MNPVAISPEAAAVERRTPSEYAAFAGMCAIWGSTFLVIRIGNDTVPPLWAATIRLALGATLNFLVARVTGARYRGGDALRSAVQFGALNLGISFGLLYWGERLVPSGIAAVLFATLPLSTGVFAWALGLQPLARTRVVAGFLGLAGVALIFRGEMKSGIPQLPLVAVFAAATLSAFSSAVLKKGPPQSTFVMNSIAATVGMVICFLASLLLGEPHVLPRASAQWGPIVYLAVMGNLGAYVLWGWLITRWRVTTLAVGAFIIPIIAVTLGSIVRGESPSPMTYPGAALVLLGVGMTLRESSR